MPWENGDVRLCNFAALIPPANDRLCLYLQGIAGRTMMSGQYQRSHCVNANWSVARFFRNDKGGSSLKSDCRGRGLCGVLLPAACGTLLVLALFALFYALFDIYPFGVKSIVWCDMEQQAVPLLLQCKQILERGESLLYTQLNAGGMSFYGVFFFFLSNPLSFCVLLTDMPVSSLMNLLVPLKLAMAAGSMVILLRRQTPKLCPALAVLLGLMYGFCGYGLMYYQNLMWLDVQALAPLLLVAVDALLQKGKALPYFCCICLNIVFCYYIGYMTVVFLLLYVGLYAYFTPRAERKKLHLHDFWLTSAMAALTTAFVWLPSFLQIMRSARSGNLLQSLANCRLFHALGDRFVLLAATAIVFAVLPFLFCKDLPMAKEEQRRMRALCVLFVAAVVFDPINAMWHTGSYQAFPIRWAFFMIMISLRIAAQLLSAAPIAKERQKLPRSEKTALMLLPVLCITLVVLLLTVGNPYITSYVETLWVDFENGLLVLIATVVTAVGYFLVLRCRCKGSISQRVALSVCAVLFAGEMTLHTYCNVCAVAEEDTLYTQTYSAADRIHDDDFYRLKMTRKYAHVNMVGAIGYPTMAHYTSLTRADYMEGVKKMGYSSYWMEVSSTGGTVLTDALWGVKYQLGQRRDFDDWVTEVWTDDVLSIGKSSITLPQAIRVQQAPDAITDLPGGKRSDVQAYLAAQKLGDGDAVVSYPVTKTENLSLTETESGVQCTIVDESKQVSDIRYTLYVGDAQYLYFDLYTLTGTRIANPRNESVNISVNGVFVEQNYPQSSNNGLVSLGRFENEYVTVRALVHQNFECESFGVFGIREAALVHAAATLPKDDLHYEKGRYTVTTAGDTAATLVLAIPYDEGMTAYINGEKAEVYRVNTCETAVRVPAGSAAVELRFFPSGLKVALLLSGAGLLLMGLYLLLRRKYPQIGSKVLGSTAEKTTLFALVAVLIAIYLFPMIVSFVGIWL